MEVQTVTDENASDSVPIVKLKPIEPKPLVEPPPENNEPVEQSLAVLGSSPPSGKNALKSTSSRNLKPAGDLLATLPMSNPLP